MSAHPAQNVGKSEVLCLCGHGASCHYRRRDGTEGCAEMQMLRDRFCTCGKFIDRRFANAPIVAPMSTACRLCGHRYEDHNRKTGRCLYLGGCTADCQRYETSVVPDLMSARQLGLAGVRTVMVVVPLAHLSDLDEVSIAQLLDRELMASANAVYLRRDGGYYLVLKNVDDRNSVGEVFYSPDKQRAELLDLRRRLSEKPL